MSGDRGAKPGSGAINRDQEGIDRKERQRLLALETIDLAKDPYLMRNHLGSYECKLCLTGHNNVGNYLAHTQGKRHQTNLARRSMKDAKEGPIIPALVKKAIVPKKIKIGRPGYRVVKQRDPDTNQRSLLFQVEYPEIEEGLQPRHRLMSAFEQRIEAVDKNYQYLLFAAEPYETIAFKIPNKDIEKDPSSGKFFFNWDRDRKLFTLHIYFKDE
eukprot:TRINITY_DN21535_c0_g1_i1.p1 TRINITY_DN21535_c0_g1~~TRINITY_DN21535_c0_g1_i1.p1  ORF type:complete len:214 (-),score=39.92 TRINITY_DN21535_c0_g1_i1:42-683(-)